MDDKDNKQQQAPINVWGVANIGCTIENPTYQTLVVPPEEQKAQEAEIVEEEKKSKATGGGRPKKSGTRISKAFTQALS